MAEVKFLEEYISVMKPVTQALNILQSEGKMFMGFLLPMISNELLFLLLL